MKILHIMPYTPYPPIFGGALREYHLLKNMAKNNHVTLVTYGGPGDDVQLVRHLSDQLEDIRVVPESAARRYHRLAQFYALWTSCSYAYLSSYSYRMQKQLDELLAREHYDIIQNEFSVMGNFELNSDALKILDEHNVEYDNFYRMALNNKSAIRRMFYRREYLRMRKEELQACKEHDLIFVTSHRDKAKLDEDVPDTPKYVLPNGVDMNFFHPSADTPEPHSLVFTGMMGYVPNNDAMIYFIDEILPMIQKEIPDVKIYIVGNSPPQKLKVRASDRVIVTGFVDDVRPYVWRSSVYVVPLRMGGGTRLKVLEALSMKKTVVSTSIGCEGIAVKNNESIRIADDPEHFAKVVVDLLKNQERRRSSDPVVERGYELVRDHYEWEIVGEKMQQIYDSAIHSKVSKESEDNNLRQLSSDSMAYFRS